MKKKPLKKGSGVTSSGARGVKSDTPSPNHNIFANLYEPRVTDKKRYSRPEVDKMIAEAIPEATPFDQMVSTRKEFNRLSEEISSIENQLRHYCNARKECEKRLATLIAKVKSTADETQP